MKYRFTFSAGRALAGVLLTALIAGSPAFAQAPAAGTSPAATTPNATAADIRDIRGPEPVGSNVSWALWLAGGALLVLGGYGAWRWHARRRLAPVKLPYEIALERLETIRALMRPDSVRLFSIEASDIVRRYVEKHFQVMAAHRTTEEFLHDLLDPSNALLAEQRALLADFLQHCDLAKFGAWTLSVPEMEIMHRSARRFVFITGRPGLSGQSPEAAPSPADKDTYDSLAAT